MRDPLSVSRLADIIDQARGKAPADLVIKSVGIFDLTSGDVTVGDIAIARRPHRRHLPDLRRRHRDRRARAHRRAGLHRQPRPLRIDAWCRRSSSTAAWCRAARRRRSAIPMRSATCWACPGCNSSSKCSAGHGRWTCACSSRPACRRPHLETSGARLEAEDLLPFKHHPKVLGLAEFMNVPGVLNKDPAVLAQARGLLRRADRRPFAAAVVLRPQRLHRRRRAQLPRDDRRPPRRARSSPRACRS